MASILLKAKNIEVNHLFRDPKTDIVYIMRAHDNNEGMCIAQTPDGEYWECNTNYEVYTEQIDESASVQPDMENSPHKEDMKKFGESEKLIEFTAYETLGIVPASEEEAERLREIGAKPVSELPDPREKCRQCQGHGCLLGMPSQSCSHCAGTGFTSLGFDEDDKVARFVMNRMERKCSKCGGHKVCNKGHPYKEFECDHCDGSGTRIEKASLAEVVDMIEEAMNDPEATHVKRTS